MPIVINSNPTATSAASNLSRASDALRKSLSRLSSGYRIVSPEDDAGGLAVAYKLASQLKRNSAIKQNVQNGISFLQVQDAALTSAGTVVSRMAELRAMAQDVTKNTSDIENYSKEFLELQKHLGQLYREKFNGVSLFAVSGADRKMYSGQPNLYKGTALDGDGNLITKFSRRIYTHDSGQAADGNVSIGVINFQDVFKLGTLDSRYVQNFSGKFANLANAGGMNRTIYSTAGAGMVVQGSVVEVVDPEVDAMPSGAVSLSSAFYPLVEISSNSVSINSDGSVVGYYGARFTANEDLEDAVNWRFAIRERMETTNGTPSLSVTQVGTQKLLLFDLPGSTYDYTLQEFADMSEGMLSLNMGSDNATHYGTNLGTYFESYYEGEGNTFDGSGGTGVYPSIASFADIMSEVTTNSSGSYQVSIGSPFSGGDFALGFNRPGAPSSSSTDSIGAEEDDTTTIEDISDDSSIGDTETAYSTESEEVSSPDENAEVFTDEGFLSSILFVSMEQFTDIINRIAHARAENGAEQSRLLKVEDLLSSKMSNLEAAHGRIMDVDVALESSRLARNNVLVQSSAAMVAQANQLTGIALTILNG